MASQPQPLCPAVPRASPAGTGPGGLAAGSPEKGTARPKPPVRPKPRVLPKPALPTKPPPVQPPPVQPPPAPRHPRPELPSAEKMNRLAGPQPYSGGGAGGPLRRPSFTLRAPETPNGKGLPSPTVAAAEEPCPPPSEGLPPAPLTPARRGPAPFRVTPVGTRPERFPGTTVEEILAKMDREGLGSPERARLSPFCPDPSPRFGSKTFSAFRRRPSGEGDRAPPGEGPQAPQPMAGELGTRNDGHTIPETSSSPPAGPSGAGDPRGRRRPLSPPDLSSLQLGTLGPPGSPRPPACPAPAPGAPFQSAEPSASAPGSPDAPPELPAPGSPTLAPGSPEPPAWSPIGVPAPGAPSATAEPRLGASHSPGSPHTPGEGSPNSASPPGTPKLHPRVTCPPGSPEAAAEHPSPPSPPSEPPAKASRPPGSPEGPDDSPVPLQSPEGPDGSPPTPSRDLGLWHSAEGVLQPQMAGQGLEGLGGSLSALSQPRGPLSDPSLGSGSSWSLSQSFEWTFPSRGARQLVSTPHSPIRETTDSGLSEEGESDGADPAPHPLCSQGDSSSDGPGPMVGGPCPGGPIAQREPESSAEEEEAEQEVPVPCFPLGVMEPGRDPAGPEPPVGEDWAPPAPATAADCPGSLQGPGGPGQAEGPPRDPDPHGDPGWLTELLASPGPHSTGHSSLEAPEGLLGWARKDLCSEFGIGHPAQAGAFDWTREAAAGDGDWPGEMERDQEFGTTPSWDSTRSIEKGERQDGPFSTSRGDWGSSHGGTELVGDAGRGCSEWPQPHSDGESSVLRDPDLGASKSTWGTSYSREEMGCREADWSHGTGHGQQQDQEPGSGQPGWASRFVSRDLESQDGDVTPAWAGKYGTSDVGTKERELSPGWASKYSSRDPDTKDFTLGWAGRSSTGDPATPEKEFSTSRAGWDSRYSSRDMESQDREFSPSRPAQAGEYSKRDMESQDREFSPSRPAQAGEYSKSDTESQDREFSPSRAAEASKDSSRDMETQDGDFKPTGVAWGDKQSSREVESQDGQFSSSSRPWDDGYSTQDMESQDREFSPSRAAGASEQSTRDMESWDGESRPSRPAWDVGYSTQDVKSQDQEFSPSRWAKASEDSSRDMGTWDDGYSTRDVGTEDRDGKPCTVAEASKQSTRDVDTRDGEFSSIRAAWDEGYSTRDVEIQDREFSPSILTWDDRYSSRDAESRDEEFSSSGAAWTSEGSSRGMETWEGRFSPIRPAQTSEGSTGDMETRDGDSKPSRASWDDGYSTKGMESQDQEFSPSRRADASQGSSRDMGTWDDGYSTPEGEFSPCRPPWASGFCSAQAEPAAGGRGAAQQSWASDHGAGQASPASASGAREGDVPSPPAQGPGWGGTSTRDWAEGQGGPERHSPFDIETEQVPDPGEASCDGSTSWAGGVGSRDLMEPLGGWRGGLPFGSPQGAGLAEPGWSQDLDAAGHSAELQDTEAKRQEWARAFGARCAARSREREQSPGESPGMGWGSISDPSLLVGDAPTAPLPAERPQSEPLSSTEEREVPEPAAALPSPPACPPPLGAAGGALPDTECQGTPSDHPDGKSPPSWEEEGVPQPEVPPDAAGQEFTFLEDTEVLDSRVYRSKASLGRKRSPRPPALRPGATSQGDSWIFRDSTEPRPCPLAASSDEEAVEEPKSRRARGSPSGRGVRVPLFPSLSTSALKAKLRGRNRSAEEGAALGDSKTTSPRDPHVQRSKSCKIPGLSGKPLMLPPKPEKPSGSDASPPHWLQALKLKKKKP